MTASLLSAFYAAEPSSLLVLGTALFALSFLIRRVTASLAAHQSAGA